MAVDSTVRNRLRVILEPNLATDQGILYNAKICFTFKPFQAFRDKLTYTVFVNTLFNPGR